MATKLLYNVRNLLLALPEFPESQIYLALSGGQDSMVLLHILAHCFPEKAAALHVNYHLRGDESEGDEAFVRKTCHDWGIKLQTLSVDMAESMKQDHRPLQVIAREKRYAWFAEQLDRNKPAYLLTAHHAQDKAETLLMNLFSGTGPRGLASIPGQRERIVRPLLNVGKADIKLYAELENVPHREDSSNAKLDYERNRVRHQLLPTIEAEYPSAVANMARSANYVAEALALAEPLVLDTFKKAVEKTSTQLKLDWRQLPETCRKAWPLYVYLGSEGLSLSLLEAEEAQRFLEQRKQGHYRKIGSHYLEWRDGIAHIGSQLPRAAQQAQASAALELGKSCSLAGRLFQLRIVETADFGQEQSLFLQGLGLPLELKTFAPEEGYWMQPLGMRGKKRVAKILIDQKIPQSQRQKQVMVMGKGNEVLALPLLGKVSEKAKVKQRKGQVLCLHWRKDS